MTSVIICPKCSFTSENPFNECPMCGIIIEKYIRADHQKKEKTFEEPLISETDNNDKNNSPIKNFLTYANIKELIFSVDHDMNPINFGGRVIIFLILMIWGWKLIFSSVSSNYTAQCFWHLVNMPFHEAGHVVFGFFGKFITSLGGTLGQMLMPLICMGVFILRTRDSFAGAVCLWWFAENFMDIAPYINDARAGVLPLLGGNTGQSSPYGFHDWEFLLTETGLLKYDHFLARLSYSTGTCLMLVSFAWAGYLLWKQYKYVEI